MSRRAPAVVERKPAAAAAATRAPVLQRKCGCGKRAAGGGECEACRERPKGSEILGGSASPAVRRFFRGAGPRPAGSGRRCDLSGLPVRSAAQHGRAESAHVGVAPGGSLRVGAVDDPLEREAERIAEQITRDGRPRSAEPARDARTHAPGASAMTASRSAGLPDGLARRPIASARPAGTVRRRAGPGRGEAPVGFTLPRSGSRPLSRGTRAYMEPRLGVDFSQVRVHTGESAERAAARIHARAFTHGREIWLGRGERESDRRLMAHELVHVLQQSGGRRETATAEADGHAARYPEVGSAAPVIQRTLNCHLRHIEEECAQADASCMAVQGGHCASSYPGAEDISELHANAVAGANAQRPRLPNASRNLLHFLGASGTELVMPVDVFRNHDATKDKLGGQHRDRFIAGVRTRLGDGRLTAGGSVPMQWTGTANAFSFQMEDLGLAVGGYTLCSNVDVSTVRKADGSVEMTFDSWRVQAFDCYNWDPGKGIGGLFGAVTDNDLCCLQNAGRGKHFRIRTDPWDNTHTPSMAKATVSGPTSPSTGSAPPATGSEPESEGR